MIIAWCPFYIEQNENCRYFFQGSPYNFVPGSLFSDTHLKMLIKTMHLSRLCIACFLTRSFCSNLNFESKLDRGLSSFRDLQTKTENDYTQYTVDFYELNPSNYQNLFFDELHQKENLLYKSAYLKGFIFNEASITFFKKFLNFLAVSNIS